MKWSFASVGLIVMGLIGVTIIMLFQNITTNNENDYYLLKEVTEASMIDAIDMQYYRETGELKITKDKFVESFTRRFAESTIFVNSDYTINYFDIMEDPPKVTVSINTGIGEYTIYQDTSDYNVYNTLSAILEYTGKTETSIGSSYVNGTPLVSKKFTKVYYSIPSCDANKCGAEQPLNLPEELNSKNISNVEISSVNSLGTVTDKGELLYAMLNRDIDWTLASGDSSTDFSSDGSISKEFDSIIKVNDIRSEVRKCIGSECDQSLYWIDWKGTNVDKKKGITIQKFEITWEYDEYEYAD